MTYSGPSSSTAAKKVSVLMITYNHEAYIAQAIESALMQVTDFDYEIVIGDDCSTDGTPKIISDFALKYPDKIRPLLRDTNLGMNRNLIATLQACKGQYIAFLEGDDYWTSPGKLQKQVDFLDAHPDYVLCFHNALVIYEDGSKDPHPYHEDERAPTYTIEDLLGGNFMNTCSVMFRAGLVSHVPERFFLLRMGDWPLHLLNAQHGAAGYLDDVMSAYRVHKHGVWSLLQRIRQLEIEADALETVSGLLQQPYKRMARRQLARRLYHLLTEYEKLGDHDKVKAYTTRFLRVKAVELDIWGRDFTGLVIRVYAPRLFRVLSFVSRRLRQAAPYSGPR